jgi:hypothetical protein
MFAESLRGSGAEFEYFGIAENISETRAAFHRERHHRLESFVHGDLVFKRRPIEKTHAVQCFPAVGIDVGRQTPEQGG